MIGFIQKVYYHIKNFVYKKKNEKIIRDFQKNDPSFGLIDIPRKIPVIVSLTSYGKRFGTLDLCIKSLLRQTTKPDRIILYLAEKDRDNLPQKIINLKKYGLEIIFVEDDLKPHKKYYYAMKDNPNAIIITTDDDVIYDQHLVEELLKSHYLFPNAIIAGRARIIASNSDGFLPYEYWKLTDVANKPSIKLLATGVGGVLYPPHLLDRNMLLNKEHIKKYIHVDDLWLKAVEIVDQIPTVVCDLEVDRNRIEILSAQTVGLSQINVLKNRNDSYWAKLNQEYGLFSRVKSFD